MTQITIEKLGSAGDGVAPGPIYAPYTLPGEVVEGEVVDGRIETPKIVTPSSDRIAAPCAHFKRCGGCALQHASDDFVASWKRAQVADALSARGIEDAEIRPTITSPTKSRRRATFAARRTKKAVQIGFYGRKSDEIIPLTACEVVHPDLMSALPAIEAGARLGASRKGAIRATVTKSENGLDIAVEGGKSLEKQALLDAAMLADSHDLARLTWNGEILVTRHDPHQRIGPALVAPPPGGFLQATMDGEATLLNAAKAAIGAPSKLVDLFAGCGAFSIPFSDRAEVHAVEGDAALLEALNKGWKAVGGLARITTETRDLFRRPLLAEELNAYPVAIIDPPRAGARAQMEQLAASTVPVIASLSCDAGSFARDARTLIDGGYSLDWVQPVDQFRWSPHVEIAAKFSR